MAKLLTLNETEWAAWLEARPPVIQALAARWPPDRIYRNTQTGQYMQIDSYIENGTVSAVVLTGYRQIDVFALRVWGIDPQELEECEIPPRIDGLDRGLYRLSYSVWRDGCVASSSAAGMPKGEAESHLKRLTADASVQAGVIEMESGSHLRAWQKKRGEPWVEWRSSP